MRAAEQHSLRAGLTAALLLLACVPSLAQTKTGTTVGQFLMIEPSARTAAMGNAGVTAFDEAMAMYYNPGAAGHLAATSVQFTHTLWLANITYNYGAVALRMGEANTLLLNVTALNSGEMDVTTVEQPHGTGERYSVQDLALGVGLARRLTDRFSAGLQVKFVQEKIWHSTMSAFGLDLGVLYQLPFRAYLGASVSNFGTRGRFDGRDLRIRYDQDPDRFGDNSGLPAALRTDDYPLPVLFRVGMGVPLAFDRNNRLSLVVDAFHPSDNTESVSFGAEWTFMNVISARAGYQNLFQQDSQTGLTLGAGLQYQVSGFGMKFDYGWNDFSDLGNAQRFTLGMTF